MDEDLVMSIMWRQFDNFRRLIWRHLVIFIVILVQPLSLAPCWLPILLWSSFVVPVPFSLSVRLPRSAVSWRRFSLGLEPSFRTVVFVLHDVLGSVSTWHCLRSLCYSHPDAWCLLCTRSAPSLHCRLRCMLVAPFVVSCRLFLYLVRLGSQCNLWCKWHLSPGMIRQRRPCRPSNPFLHILSSQRGCSFGGVLPVSSLLFLPLWSWTWTWLFLSAGALWAPTPV